VIILSICGEKNVFWLAKNFKIDVPDHSSMQVTQSSKNYDSVALNMSIKVNCQVRLMQYAAFNLVWLIMESNLTSNQLSTVSLGTLWRSTLYYIYQCLLDSGKNMSVWIIHENVMYLMYEVHGALDRQSSILIFNTLQQIWEFVCLISCEIFIIKYVVFVYVLEWNVNYSICVCFIIIFFNEIFTIIWYEFPNYKMLIYSWKPFPS